MHSRGINVGDRAEIKDDVAQGNAARGQSTDGPPLVLGNGLTHWDDIGKVDGRINAHDEQAINLLGIRVLLDVPAQGTVLSGWGMRMFWALLHL